MGKIDLDKLITSLLNNKDENYRGYVVFRDIVKALEEQGLKYKDKGIKRARGKAKFKVGDWLYRGKGVPVRVTDVTPTSYSIKNLEGRVHSFLRKHIEKFYHLWTINDAKPGDILADDNWVGIFKELKPNRPSIDTFCLSCGFGLSTTGNDVHYNGLVPATNKQKNILFKVINEAGYKWDEENLKLISLTDIEKKIVAKRLYLESKGIIWSEDEWKGYKEGLEDIYKSN